MAEGCDVAVELEQELDGGQREAAFHVWVGAELMHVPVESTRCVGVPILTMYVRKGNWNVSEMDSRTLLDYFFHFSSHVATLRCINRKKKKKKSFRASVEKCGRSSEIQAGGPAESPCVFRVATLSRPAAAAAALS